MDHDEQGLDRHLAPIFDHLFEGVQILDHDWRYVYLNAAAARHGRRSRDALLGRRIVDVYPGIEETEMFAALERCMADRTPERLVNEFDYPRGGKAWFDLRINPVPPGVLVLSIDITDARASEEQLREARKMEAVGRLAGGVAHDFNNLLTVIGGYSDLILAEMEPDDRFRAALEEIHQASQRAAELTQRLLAFSRRQRLEPRILDLNDAVERLDGLLRRLLGADVDLVVRLAPGAGQVLADPGQLEQVVMNLALNARDAMPLGGKLTIETAAVELDEEYARTHVDATAGPHVLLAVTDTGTGMDDETMTRIFEPFFTTKQLGEGTGLGLATVYGIVKQSGGNIWVYSEPGRGSTFKVYFPRSAESAADPASAPPRPALSRTGTGTVLVVEDHASVRGFIASVLVTAGYSVLEADDPVEASALAERHADEISLLLVDLVLPGESGRELADRIRAAQPELPVIFMSGYTDDAMVHRGMLESGTPFVDKPITAAALLARVRAVLDGEG